MELALKKKKKRLSIDDFRTQNQPNKLKSETLESAKGGNWARIIYGLAGVVAAGIEAYDELSDDCH